MLKKRYRRLLDHIFAIPSFIDDEATITGNLHCNGDLVVAGSVKGESEVVGAFTLLDVGQWVGDIEAANAVLAGQVQGNIIITERLEIRKSASTRGSVRARTIAVADDAPVIRFEKKRRR